MELAAIFQDLEYLYDFQTIGYGDHFAFQNEAKILHRHVFMAISHHYEEENEELVDFNLLTRDQKLT